MPERAASPSVVHRIIDANANRTREALRVMEEAARFVLDDESLTREIKQLRHDLADALQLLPALLGARDTRGDVGTTITTPSEESRQSVREVAVAAGKRLSEALRAMEEYGKTLAPSGPEFAGKIEALRYRGYTIEQNLTLALQCPCPRPTDWRVCVLISSDLCADGDYLAVAKAALRGGAQCIQLREKQLDSAELLSRASRLAKLCNDNGAALIINDRVDIALLSGAHGVHLGQTDLPVSAVRRLAGRGLLVGVSTSSIEQAHKALADGADYCGVGPMFPTTTKHKDVIVGPAYLREFVAWGKLPHLAIGGISSDNIDQLTSAGVRGVAVSSCICKSPDPAAAVRQLRQAVEHQLA